MDATLSRRGFIEACAFGSLSLTVGCGTILYPERRYQPHGDVDLKVVALDTLGLLLFFIPGVIAFAVDFTTGAIYLPPNQSFGAAVPPAEGEQFVTVQVPQHELTEERIEKVASRHAGRDVQLVAGEYHTAPLNRLGDFWSAQKRMIEKYLGDNTRNRLNLALQSRAKKASANQRPADCWRSRRVADVCRDTSVSRRCQDSSILGVVRHGVPKTVCWPSETNLACLSAKSVINSTIPGLARQCIAVLQVNATVAPTKR